MIIVDHLSRWMICTEDEFPQIMLMRVLRAELGIHITVFTNLTTMGQQNTRLEPSENIEDNNQCSDIPTLKIESACFLFLEAAKLVYMLAKEYIKHKQEKRIRPSTGNALRRLRPQKLEKLNLTRSESFPTSSEQVLRFQRRTSLPLEKPSDRKANKPSSCVASYIEMVPLPRTGQEKMPNLWEIVKKFCLRTSSLFTIFIIIGLGVLMNDAITNDGSSQLSVIAHIITERIMVYMLVIVLSLFDADIHSYVL